MFAVYSQPAADHVLRSQFNNTAGKGVCAPCFEGLFEHVFTVIAETVAVGLVPWARTDEKSILIFDHRELSINRLADLFFKKPVK